MGQRMQSKHLLIGAAIAALLAAASTSAVAESAAERQLIEQGQYWQQRDSARATQAWNKLLLARPGSADALLGLGQLAVQAQQVAKAQSYLAQIKQLHPDHPDIALLEQDIALMGDGPSALLNQGRMLRRQDNPEEAVKL